MSRHVHRQLMRNELHNFITIVPVTVYHHGSYVETYSRFMSEPLLQESLCNPDDGSGWGLTTAEQFYSLAASFPSSHGSLTPKCLHTKMRDRTAKRARLLMGSRQHPGLLLYCTCVQYVSGGE